MLGHRKSDTQLRTRARKGVDVRAPYFALMIVQVRGGTCEACVASLRQGLFAAFPDNIVEASHRPVCHPPLSVDELHIASPLAPGCLQLVPSVPQMGHSDASEQLDIGTAVTSIVLRHSESTMLAAGDGAQVTARRGDTSAECGGRQRQ